MSRATGGLEGNRWFVGAQPRNESDSALHVARCGAGVYRDASAARQFTAGGGVALSASGVITDPLEDVAITGRLRQQLITLDLAIARELRPMDPLLPEEAVARRLLAPRPGFLRQRLFARSRGGELLGTVELVRAARPSSNAHLCRCELRVAVEHRRAGVGRALLMRAATLLHAARPDAVFTARTSDRQPAGSAFAVAVGAEMALALEVNELTISRLDRRMLSAWAAAEHRGYRIVGGRAPLSDELVDLYREAIDGMNDAPRGALVLEDEHLTAEEVRESERWLGLTGQVWHVLVAVDAHGRAAGMTEITYDPALPTLVEQGATAVLAAHRGHGLGLWLKARMLAQVITEWPQAVTVRTDNAPSNYHMIEINRRLGFVHADTTALWQLPVRVLARA